MTMSDHFEFTNRYSDEYPVSAIRIHAAAACCDTAFRDVAAILEPTSPNPCLLLYKPLGFNMVRNILADFERICEAANDEADHAA